MNNAKIIIIKKKKNLNLDLLKKPRKKKKKKKHIPQKLPNSKAQGLKNHPKFAKPA